MKRSIAHIILLLLCVLSGFAQSPRFYLGFDQILDNREYFTDYGYHQTIFGARINTGASFTFDSTHQIHAGINYMYEYGGDLLGVTPQIDLYYSYRSDRLDLFVGSFPRRGRMDYPLLLLTDSLDYYRPNMEGASVRYNWDWGTVHGWVDWAGRETEEVRESILAGFDATLRAAVFYVSTIATRYHLARIICTSIVGSKGEFHSCLFSALDNSGTRQPEAIIDLQGHTTFGQSLHHLIDAFIGPQYIILVGNIGRQVGWIHMYINGFNGDNLYDVIHQLIHEILGISNLGLLGNPEPHTFPIVIGPGHGIGKDIVEPIAVLFAE